MIAAFYDPSGKSVAISPLKKHCLVEPQRGLGSTSAPIKKGGGNFLCFLQTQYTKVQNVFC